MANENGRLPYTRRSLAHTIRSILGSKFVTNSPKFMVEAVDEAKQENAWDWGDVTTSTPTSTSQNQQVERPSTRTVSNKRKLSSDENVEGYSKLRIKNRSFSSTEMNEQMEDRTMIPIRKLVTHSEKHLSNPNLDWVTIGVLSSKSEPKTSSNNKKFSTWTISNLEESLVTCFLFGEAHEEHWMNILRGSILVLINPGILPANEKNTFSLKVSCADQIVVLGTSPDFGICKGQTPAGKRCSHAVNVQLSPYCRYHLVSKYKTAGKGRLELNGAFSSSKFVLRGGDGMHNVSRGTYDQRHQRNHRGSRTSQNAEITLGVRTKILSTGEMISEAKTNPKTKPVRNKTSGPSLQFDLQQPQPYSRSSMKSNQIVAKLLGAARVQGLTSQPRTLHSHVTQTKSTPKRDVLGEALALSSKKHDCDDNQRPTDRGRQINLDKVTVPAESTIYRSTRLQNTAPGNWQPILTKSNHETRQAQAQMKQKQAQVAQIFKAKGVDIHQSKAKFSSTAMKNLVKSSRTSSVVTKPKNPDHDFLSAFGGHTLNLKSAAGLRLLERKSAHVEEVEDVEHAKLSSHLDHLDRHEHVSDLRQQMKTLDVSAFECRSCVYVMEKPVESCGERGHDIRRVRAIKRFFECQHCKTRCSLLNAKIPTMPCRKCNQMNWKACSMYREKKGPDTRPAFEATGGRTIQSLRFGS